MGFKEELTNDLSTVFMNKDEFAEEIKFIPKANPSGFYLINGIFDREFFAVDPETDMPVISAQPNVRVKETDLQAAVKKYDTVEIRSIVYEIIRYETDGVGTIVLFIHATA